MTIDAIYRTTATATGGGRNGRTSLQDGTMALDLAVPKEMGGPGGDAANPEKLFALGYAACFLSALGAAARQGSAKVPAGATVTATIGMASRPEGGFALTAALDCYLPGLTQAEANDLAARTHGICPYSNALRGNVDVAITARV